MKRCGRCKFFTVDKLYWDGEDPTTARVGGWCSEPHINEISGSDGVHKLSSEGHRCPRAHEQ